MKSHLSTFSSLGKAVEAWQSSTAAKIKHLHACHLHWAGKKVPCKVLTALPDFETALICAWNQITVSSPQGRTQVTFVPEEGSFAEKDGIR